MQWGPQQILTSTAPPWSSSWVSVAVLIALSSIITCTLPPLFVYLLQSYILIDLRRYVLYCLLHSNPHYFYHSLLRSSHYAFTPILAQLFSISVMFSFRSDCRVFLYLPSIRSDPIWLFPSDMSDTFYLIHIWYAQVLLLRSCSDMISPIRLDQIDQICSIFFSSGPSNFS